MRKTIFVLSVVLNSVASLQLLAAFDPTSINTDTSFGLVQSPLDAALDVHEGRMDPGFSALPGSYILGGVGNLSGLAATGSRQGNPSGPVFVGAYVGGIRPFSIAANGATSRANDDGIADGVSFEYADVADTPTSDTSSTYRWIEKQTTTVHRYPQATLVSGSLSYIQRVGSLNLGLALSGMHQRGDLEDPLTWAGTNQTVVETYHYDAQAGSPPPEAQLDYTVTTQSASPHTRLEVGLAVPVFLRSGNLGHGFEFSGSYFRRDDSRSTSVESTEPADTGPTSGILTDTRDSTVDTQSVLSLGLGYDIEMPGLNRADERNSLMVSLLGVYDLTSIDPLTIDRASAAYTVDMTQAEGDRKALSSNTTTDSTLTRSVPDWTTAEIDVSQRIHIDLGEDNYCRLGPGLSGWFTTRPEDGITATTVAAHILDAKLEETVSTDTDGDGTMDARVETTREYQVNAVPGDTRFGFALGLPVVVDLTLTDRIRLLIGSESQLSWQRRRLGEASTVVATETIDTLDADGTLVQRTETVTDPSVYGELPPTKLYSEFTLTTTQRMAFNVRLGAGVMLYIVADFSKLFDFDDLTVQAVVPLP